MFGVVAAYADDFHNLFLAKIASGVNPQTLLPILQIQSVLRILVNKNKDMSFPITVSASKYTKEERLVVPAGAYTN
jgi:hypothetical protein